MGGLSLYIDEERNFEMFSFYIQYYFYIFYIYLYYINYYLWQKLLYEPDEFNLCIFFFNDHYHNIKEITLPSV